MRCKFVPIHKGQKPCEEEAEVFFGESCYCKKHKRTAQALNAKKNYEDTQNVPRLEYSESAKDRSKKQLQDELDDGYQDPVPKKEEARERNAKKEVREQAPPKREIPKKEQIVPPPKKSVQQAPTKQIVRTKEISKNPWGRFEDPDTGILFDKNTKMAYGVQDHKTGRVLPLSTRHKEICNRHKWKYTDSDQDSSEEEGPVSKKREASKVINSQPKPNKTATVSSTHVNPQGRGAYAKMATNPKVTSSAPENEEEDKESEEEGSEEEEEGSEEEEEGSEEESEEEEEEGDSGEEEESEEEEEGSEEEEEESEEEESE